MPDLIPPDVLYDEDGYPIAVLFTLAPNPARAFRYLVENMGSEWLLDDFKITWNEDESDYKYSVSELLTRCRSIKPRFMRSATEEEGRSYEWGMDTWFWCEEDHPGAVKYWDVQ